MILLSAPYLYYSVTHLTPTPVPTSSNTTTPYHFSLREGDLYYTDYRSCSYLNQTNRLLYAAFFVNVTNRLNTPTDYVNVSFYVTNMVFSNGATIPYNSRLMLITGASHAVNLTFVFGIPLNGSVYHQIQPSVPSNGYVTSAFFAIRIFVNESEHVEEIPLADLVFSFLETPTCKA